MEIDIKPLDEEKLFTSETFTDGIAGYLQVNTPVNFDGYRVLSRQPEYIGSTQVQTTAGPMTVRFGIEASTLREAFEKWHLACKDACKTAIENLQREQFQRSIMAPGRKKT